MSQNLFKNILFDQISMCCWPRILAQIDPNRSFFTLVPPPCGQQYVVIRLRAGVSNCLKICSRKTLLEQLSVCCWPRMFVKIAPNRSAFTFGPPPFRPEIRRRLPLGFSWAALGLLLAAPGLLLAAPGLLLGGSWLLLGGPRLLLGCSWAAPGLVLGCSWAAPGCSWPAPGGSQAAPGLLPAALGLLLGFSWLLLDCSWLLLAACGCSWAAPGLLSTKQEQPSTTNNLRQFGLKRWGVRVLVST